MNIEKADPGEAIESVNSLIQKDAKKDANSAVHKEEEEELKRHKTIIALLEQLDDIEIVEYSREKVLFKYANEKDVTIFFDKDSAAIKKIEVLSTIFFLFCFYFVFIF